MTVYGLKWSSRVHLHRIRIRLGMDLNPVTAESCIFHFQCHLFRKSLRKKHWPVLVSHQAISDIYKGNWYHHNSANRQKLVPKAVNTDNPGKRWNNELSEKGRNSETNLYPLDSGLFELNVTFDILKF